MGRSVLAAAKHGTTAVCRRRGAALLLRVPGEGVFSEFDVHPGGGNPNRSAVLVVGWIRNMLEIETCKNSRQQAHPVIGLRNVLGSILQAAVSDQKIITSARQI
jgi:hypothetical protein